MRIRSIVVVISLGLLAFGGVAAVHELTKPTPPMRVPAIDIDPEAGAENIEPDAADRRERARERRRERERERRGRDAAAPRGSSDPPAAAPEPPAAPPATGDDVSDGDDAGGDE